MCGEYRLPFYNKIMSKRVQSHLISLQVYISQVHTKLKTAGSLIFQITSDGLIPLAQTQKYYIENNKCMVFHSTQVKVQVDYDLNMQQYRPKYITISIILETMRHTQSNLGYVKFNPFQGSKTSSHWDLPFETCGGESNIIFRTKYKVISKKTPRQSVKVAESVKLSLKQVESAKQSLFLKDNQDIQNKISAINQMAESAEVKSIKKQSIISEKYKEKPAMDKTKKVQSKLIYTEPRKLMPKTTSPRTKQSDYRSNMKANQQIEEMKKKIQEERAEKVRSISKLKMEVSPKIATTTTLPGQESEVFRLKEKIKFLQRKEKAYQTNLDQLNSEIDKRIAKQKQLLKMKEQLERALGQKDLKLKNSYLAVNSLSDQLQNLTIKEKVSNKKDEVREVNYKEQLRRLQEKLRQSDEELGDAVNQKNAIIKEVSEMQKKHIATLKEKDYKISQQKAKLSKLKEDVATEQKEWLNRIEELNTNASDMVRAKQQLQERVKELQQALISQAGELSENKQKLKKQRELNRQREQEYLTAQTGQLSNIKKRINEMTVQSTALRQKVKKLEFEKSQSQKRLTQLEESIKMKASDLSKHVSRINGLKKDLDSTFDQVERKKKENDNLKQNIINLNLKITEMKEKIQFQRNRREESINQLDMHINAFGKAKEGFQFQIQELRWVNVRNTDKLTQQQLKAKDTNAAILKLNEELIGKNQKIINLEEKISNTQTEKEHINNGRVSLELKVKQINESLKVKMTELQQQKRSKRKAEQLLQEQREKGKQNWSNSKERQQYQNHRLKQKQQIMRKQLSTIQQLQDEVTKRQEQLLNNKNSNQLILRQIQMTKMDRQSVKDQLNLLSASYKTLRDQFNSLSIAKESINGDLLNCKQQFAMQNKRNDLLKGQYDQYKEGVFAALQNLCNQFAVKDGTSNIIATTLLPFPDQRLSNLQIQLVQKRNSLIIKHREKLNQLESQKSILQNQLVELKNLFQSKDGQARKLETEERERLKTLLYENMMEKNSLSEQLTRERQEKEQLRKQLQKMKGELIKKYDCEQQLNGQLQMLLLEYDGLKAQNHDLSNLLHKYKQQQIKNKAEWQQRYLAIQEENSGAMDRLRQDLMEKEKMLIHASKELIEVTDKCSRSQTTRRRLEETKEQQEEKCRELEGEISFMNLEVTKLNNTIKNNQKREKEQKQSKHRLDDQLTETKNKYDILQTNLRRVQEQLSQNLIEKDKLQKEIINLQQSLQEKRTMLEEKGSSSRQKLQKKIDQNSQLKSKLIQKQSDLSLKEYYLKQKEQLLQTVTEENEELKMVTAGLKARNRELVEQVQLGEIKARDIIRQVEVMLQEKEKKEEIINRSNFALFSLQSELEDAQKCEQTLQMKERELVRLREEKAELQQYYLGELKKYRDTVSSLKKQMSKVRQDYDSTVNDYQRSIQQKQYNLTQKQKMIHSQYQKERDQFYKRVEQIDEHNRTIIADLQKRIERTEQQLSESKQIQKILGDQLNKREVANSSLRKKLDALENQNQDFKQNYLKYISMYQEIKGELDQTLKDQDVKFKEVGRQIRIALLKQFNQRIADISRKLQRVKHNEQIVQKGEALTRREVRNSLDRIFNRMFDLLSQIEYKETI